LSGEHPEVGQYVWHPSLLHLTHGVDDFEGGVCKVSVVVEKPDGIYVRLEELGDWEVSWKYLLEGQDEWRERYGKQPGRADPDLRREFNE
jgi:hypothetical protein